MTALRSPVSPQLVPKWCEIQKAPRRIGLPGGNRTEYRLHRDVVSYRKLKQTLS